MVTLLYYYPYATRATQQAIKSAARRSLEHELAITHEVSNPFGYSRQQLVQDTLGQRHSSFFFPHGAEPSPWWQGEDARLGSMAAAARLAVPLFAADTPDAAGKPSAGANTKFTDSLQTFALDQLNWILGCNPYDASMLQGTGHNNPDYGFFGTFEYTNAPGGIVNGVTSGLDDENDIDFNLSYAKTGKDYDWRWAEQWLPHDAWYLSRRRRTANRSINSRRLSMRSTSTTTRPSLSAHRRRTSTFRRLTAEYLFAVHYPSKTPASWWSSSMCNHCPNLRRPMRRVSSGLPANTPPKASV